MKALQKHFTYEKTSVTLVGVALVFSFIEFARFLSKRHFCPIYDLIKSHFTNTH